MGAVTIDLYDQHSPCGAVHIRNKTAVAVRPARASLALAYARTDLSWTGPLPRSITVGTDTIQVDFYGVNGSLAFESIPNQTQAPSLQNFEVTADATFAHGWKSVPATVVP